MSPALLGILQLDRGNPNGYGNLAGLLQSWVQDAGGFAAVGLVVYLIYALTTPTDKSQSERLRVPVTSRMLVLAGLSLVCYSLVLALLVMGKPEAKLGGTTVYLLQPAVPPPPAGSPVKFVPPAWHGQALPLLLMAGGLFALLGIGEPFIRDLFKMRWRRIWALSRLGFKEAIRFRLHWLFLIILLPYLFRNVWMSGMRPADEFRNLVGVATMAITILVLFSAVLLASFSLPTDIKNQTIHTVVTKPVERFEIVLGRFFGYSFLMTLGLVGMTAISLLLINTATINTKAQDETVKARVPARGKLEFKATTKRQEFDGTNVGREFDYRKYISGHERSNERAVWHFATVPSGLGRAAKDRVPVEFTFDIFRMTKGDENKGVYVAFRFVTHNCPQKQPDPALAAGEQGYIPGIWPWKDKDAEKKYAAEVNRLRADDKVNPEAAEPTDRDWAAANKLAEEFGYYEIRGKDVYDYAVMGVDVPAGLFRNAAKGDPGKDDKGNPLPRFSVYVKCESGGQLLGMAEPDLYLLEDVKTFSQNFVKGMFGLWCRLCIVVGLAVACSTYLSGVLSLLATATIYLLGYFTDHMNDLAANRNIGGGPFESMSRLVKAEGPTSPSGDSAGIRVIQVLDQFWAWTIRRIQNIVPDVDSFSWTHFVSEGFNVNTEYLIVNLLVTAGYLLPWGILAYYLLKSREVAN